MTMSVPDLLFFHRLAQEARAEDEAEHERLKREARG